MFALVSKLKPAYLLHLGWARVGSNLVLPNLNFASLLNESSFKLYDFESSSF